MNAGERQELFIEYKVYGDTLSVTTRVIAHKVTEDTLTVAINSAVMKVLDPVTDGFVSISFPATYVLRSVEVGKTKVTGEGEMITAETTIDIVRLKESCSVQLNGEDLVKELAETIANTVKDVMEGYVVRHVVNVGNHLKNLGEEVEITLRDGEVISGEVMGFGRNGELIIAVKGELIPVKPSQVKFLKTLWP